MAVEEEEPKGAPEWIVTFTDLTSLLVTFFVLLMTFSSFDETEREIMTIKGLSMIGQKGIMRADKDPDMIPPPQRDRLIAVDAERGADSPHKRPQAELLENMDEMGQRKDPDEIEVNFNVKRDGLLIGFGPDACFAPGSARVERALAERLTQLAEVAQHYPNLLVVEGHTDALFQASPSYPTPESLSLARAAAAAEVLLETSALSPKMLQIAGLGSKTPRNPADSALARTENRRVEVRIVALSKSRVGSLRLDEERR